MPIILTWFVIFIDELKPYWCVVYAFLLFGQAWVAGNVVAGRGMVRKYGGDFSRALSSVFVEMEEARAAADLQRVTRDWT